MNDHIINVVEGRSWVHRRYCSDVLLGAFEGDTHDAVVVVGAIPIGRWYFLWRYLLVALVVGLFIF